ncbi:MAG: F0F1 ATP synthase subunit epsilon [Bacillota bacterium]
MNLKVLLPTEVLLEEEVFKIMAEAENGFFTLLPRHVDFVAALVPGIFSYTTPPDEEERHLALDGGVLVKRGDDVFVSAARAVKGKSLAQLRAAVETELKQMDENERKGRSVLARLEADTLRRFSLLGGER